MKKILLVSGVAVAVIGVLMPWWVGQRVEAEFEAAHAPIAEATGLNLKVASYDRGWFGATAKVCVAESDNDQLCADYRIQHGPLLYRDLFGLGWAAMRITPAYSDETRSEMKTFFAEAEPVTLKVRAGFGGSARFLLETARVSGSDNDTTIDAQPLVLDAAYNAGSGRLAGTLRAPSVQVKGQGNDMNLTDMNADFDTVQLGGGLWTGKASFGIAELRTAGAEGQVEVKGLRYVAVTEAVDGKQLEASADFDIDSLSAPMMPAPAKAGLTLKMSGLDIEAMKQIQAANRGSVLASDAEKLANMMQAMQTLAMKGGRMNFSRLNLTMGAERFDGNLDIQLKPGVEGSDPMADLAQRLGAEGVLRLTQSLAERTAGAEIIQAWVVQGLANAENGDLVFRIKLADGQLTIGSQPMPLPFGAMPGMGMEAPTGDMPAEGEPDAAAEQPVEGESL